MQYNAYVHYCNLCLHCVRELSSWVVCNVILPQIQAMFFIDQWWTDTTNTIVLMRVGSPHLTRTPKNRIGSVSLLLVPHSAQWSCATKLISCLSALVGVLELWLVRRVSLVPQGAVVWGLLLRKVAHKVHVIVHPWLDPVTIEVDHNNGWRLPLVEWGINLYHCCCLNSILGLPRHKNWQ